MSEKQKAALEFAELVEGASDDQAAAGSAEGTGHDKADHFDKFENRAALAGHFGSYEDLEKFERAIAHINARHRQIYLKLAETVAPSPGDEPLRKRSAHDQKLVFRKYFQERISMGDTPEQVLNRFTDSARCKHAVILSELIAEFGG
jgi:hypothetical protein